MDGVVFQSTPPARGATHIIQTIQQIKDISIHAPREGGDVDYRTGHDQPEISIHAPREGGDLQTGIF